LTHGERSTSLHHLRPCAAIPSPVPPTPTLCRHLERCEATPGVVGTCFDGMSPRRPLCNLNSPVSKTLESVCEQQPDASTGKTTLEATSRQAQELPRRTQEPGSARTIIKSQVLHTGTGILHQKPCSTFVSHLPLAYI
jgi:hypothetical protein